MEDTFHPSAAEGSNAFPLIITHGWLGSFHEFTNDELLTNIMIYWITQTITSSMRVYYEARATGWKLVPGEKVAVPTGCLLSPIEPQLPRKWVENSFNVTHWNVMPSGGHFLALEEPSAS